MIVNNIEMAPADDLQGIIQPQTGAPLQVNFTPRQFQLELLEASLRRNSIICLQSASAKDFIAVMLIKELSEHVRKPFKNGRKCTVFVVGSAQMVSQQANVIQTHTNLSVMEYTGDSDFKPQKNAERSSRTPQVLVMTCETLLKALYEGAIKLANLNAIIFDDCHHACEKHPYSDVMKYFDSCDPAEHPHILGLTASLLRGKFLPSKLESTLDRLEQTLRSNIETAINVQSVSRYGTKPKEIVIECEPYQNLNVCCREILDILHETLNILKKCQHVDKTADDYTSLPQQAVQEAILALTGIGPLGLKLMVQLLLNEIEKFEKHTVSSFSKLLLIYTCSQLRYVRKKCSLECATLLQDGQSIWSLKLVTPKFRKLLTVLASFRPDEDAQISSDSTNEEKVVHKNTKLENTAAEMNVYDEDEDSCDDEEEEAVGEAANDTSLCGIVFADGRFTAFVLDTLLRKFQRSNPQLSFISSCSIMGHGVTGLGGMQTQAQGKRQEQMLRKFRRHETNLLFATNILEEGVDVPRCNLVVRFDPPLQYRSYIQSKARARAHSSHYVMLVDTIKKDLFAGDLRDYRKIDKILQNKCHFREADVGDQVNVEEVDKLLPPLMPSEEEGAPKLTVSGAITLVNRYCAKLPSDSFTHLSPTWHITSHISTANQEMYQCTLQLPINSPLRGPVVGCEMPSKKLAKMSAALETCTRLYQAGELNNKLLPVGKETILEDNNYESEIEEVPEGEGRPGTIQRRQYYEKAIAGCLVNTLPSPNSPCYLYVISMSLSVPLPSVLNVRERELHDPKETSQCFGILTSKAIPKVPAFPVYTRDGELSVSIDLVTSAVALTSDELHQAKAFHQCVFSDVLRLQKPNIVYDPDGDKASYIVVPLNKSRDVIDCPLTIDWDFLNKVSLCGRALDHPPSLPCYTNEEFNFDPQLYKDAVVTPIYRNIDQPQRYFVAEVLIDTLVTSPFPSEKYEKYVDYFFERYEIEISNFRQPLLDVDCMSSRLNLLTPRYLNHKGKALPIGSKQAKKSNAQKKQYLVPELCYIYPIPASMWRKAICLPSILYRLNALLLAEELRVVLAQEAGIGCESLPSPYPYEALSFGWQGLELLELNQAKKNHLCAIGEKCNDEPKSSNNRKYDSSVFCRSENLLLPSSCEQLSCNDSSEELSKICGPSPSMLLQALTMSNASDGFNLERLEMLGDSFLKQAVTVYLYCCHHNLHEGKLSFLRSKQVSNYNLYRLGKQKGLANWMQVCLFDPAINWLPPGYTVRESKSDAYCVPPEQVDEYISDDDAADFDIGTWEPSEVEIGSSSQVQSMWLDNPYLNPIDYDSDLSDEDMELDATSGAPRSQSQWSFAVGDPEDVPGLTFTGRKTNHVDFLPDLPYEIHTQQSLSDKSVADCVEALIGCCLVSCGFRSALLFLCWIGLRVLPKSEPDDPLEAKVEEHSGIQSYGYLPQPPSPLFTKVPHAEDKLQELLAKIGHHEFEATISYTFRDKAYLVQALSHASYHLNQVTDCYQRLEFLGDAILDYLITKHLYDHYRNLSPGALTDLRSALVNNTIFASLAVKYGFHQFFLSLSPDLFRVIGNFVAYVKEKNEALGMESELKLGGISDTDEEQEDIEVPKALGDIFESIAGAVYLDSGMSMDAVWEVYYPMMKQQIEQYAANLPISPVRELLEMEPETAKFGPPERTIDGKTRVTVNVVGKGQFKGVGRNYRIAKATAARCALRHLKK
ncbi:Endoribonuclease Dicer [Holothuria leucospilota]|uniref:ribonuclease III n=1 Tax=Holothuria leucospilota TaxID=206669 RepID=A0A9Q1CIG5_HOLLE|nr:Endoribonuclease Dicer [Holothuria leucospilota]